MKNILAVIGGITVIAVIVLVIGVGIAAIGSRAAPVATRQPIVVTIASQAKAQPVALQPEPTQAPASTQPPRTNTVTHLKIINVLDPCPESIIYAPVPNRRAVGIEVAFFNDSAPDEVTMNVLDFTLIGSDGLPYPPHLGSCDRQIGVGDLTAGESIAGVVGFDLPPDVKPVTIRYKGYGMDLPAEAAIP
jgi:hypothetical protein